MKIGLLVTLLLGIVVWTAAVATVTQLGMGSCHIFHTFSSFSVCHYIGLLVYWEEGPGRCQEFGCWSLGQSLPPSIIGSSGLPDVISIHAGVSCQSNWST